jgi:hypothetical protein
VTRVSLSTTQLWHTITQSDNITAAQLNTVLAIAFAELKKYVFYYWFAFPAFIAKPAWTVDSPWVSVESAFNSDQVDYPISNICSFRIGLADTATLLLLSG